MSLPNSGVSVGEVSQTIEATNNAFQSMGLTTRVQWYNGDPAEFKRWQIDETDAVAILGRPEDIVNTVEKFDPYNAENLKSDLKGAPEVSPGGYLITLRGDMIRDKEHRENVWGANTSIYMSFLIMHGAGHNSTPTFVPGTQTIPPTHNAHPNALLRWEGNWVKSSITGSLLPDLTRAPSIKSLSEFMNNNPRNGVPRNSKYVNQMKIRFGTAPAKDNRLRNTREKHDIRWKLINGPE